jgi:hypothetical protein
LISGCFFSIECCSCRVVKSIGPFRLNRPSLLNHLTGKHLRKTIDCCNHTSWDGLRERVVNDTAERFFAKLRSLEKVISLGLLRVKRINQDPEEAAKLVFHFTGRTNGN